VHFLTERVYETPFCLKMQVIALSYRFITYLIRRLENPMSHNILRIDASPRTAVSVSRKLTDKIVDQLGGTVATRDLNIPLPQLSELWVEATFTPPEDRTEAQKAELALSDMLVEELQAADTIVIGFPLYNFGVPACLKAWMDQVARAGVTFEYTATGPQGLLSNKRVILVMASGGVEAGSAMDFATDHLITFLGFLGLTDVELVRADQLSSDADAVLKAADDHIVQLAA
jgi:FMN-dependent NADH-azoreductase